LIVLVVVLASPLMNHLIDPLVPLHLPGITFLIKVTHFLAKSDIPGGSLATGATAAAATVLNWAYQVGSSRLGTVDLFACEMSAICRVFLVVDYARHTVNGANKTDRAKPFTSAENYTPVGDANLAELKPLDAEVITYVTEFYTYRKTMTDCLRQIAALSTEDHQGRQICMEYMIFMQFLMYESGHKSIQKLVEFEPNRSESLINIFCSELIVYRFLLEKCADFRFDRLMLRKQHYLKDVPDLYKTTMAPYDDPNNHWERAKTTAGELKLRFEEVFPGHIIPPNGSKATG
jgi:hypothetical protein